MKRTFTAGPNSAEITSQADG